MAGYVDQEYVDSVDVLTNDNTIGLLDDTLGDVESEGLFDIGRLRRALLAYEDEMRRPATVDVSVVETDEGRRCLALQDGENASQVILLADLRRPDGRSD